MFDQGIILTGNVVCSLNIYWLFIHKLAPEASLDSFADHLTVSISIVTTILHRLTLLQNAPLRVHVEN